MSYATHFSRKQTGLSNSERCYHGVMVNATGDRPRITPKGERTRARIVDAAARLIHERGVAGTTLDDVKAAAEVSGSQLYHYFPDKDDLVQAVIDHQADTIVDNQRHADLASIEGLQAWRDMVVAQARATEARGAAPLDRSAVNSPKATLKPALSSPPVSSGGQPPSATGYEAFTLPGISRPASTQTTWPSPSSPRSKGASSSPRSSGTPVPSRQRSTPSSPSPPADEHKPDALGARGKDADARAARNCPGSSLTTAASTARLRWASSSRRVSATVTTRSAARPAKRAAFGLADQPGSQARGHKTP